MREWLLTNGLGGYASGTVEGVATRRYHGLLIAALGDGLGRTMLLNRVEERLLLQDGTAALLTGRETVANGLQLPDVRTHFDLDAGLPVWRYEAGGVRLVKTLVAPAGSNTVCLTYRLDDGSQPARIELRPAVHFRPQDGALAKAEGEDYHAEYLSGGLAVTDARGGPSLHLAIAASGGRFGAAPDWLPDFEYRIEASRGYDHRGPLWTPGTFLADLARDRPVTLIASDEAIGDIDPLAVRGTELARRRGLVAAADPAARAGTAARLVLAADQFIITPVSRPGAERTVIAGYHWFSDWGRDAMIALEGLTLVTGRHADARAILLGYARAVRDGLIPNLFPEGHADGSYNTADATLWFVHAADRYLRASGDREILRELLPVTFDAIRRHIEGTRFGIGVDPADGLLRQGEAGVQLTWMDAKVGDRVVTPRRGKAVEINALWYNALRVLEDWLVTERGAAAAAPVARQAELARESFNRKFWYPDGGYLYDVVDGDAGSDAACRPNQLFAISLPHAVLDRSRWESVLEIVSQRLLTPAGLRTLFPEHPDYHPRCEGDQAARDAAYHQGTVWPWLLGPWVDAWLAAHPNDLAGARQAVLPLCESLDDYGIGSLGEIFDGDAPHTPRGCIAQAWSVAEALRAWRRTEPGVAAGILQ